MRLSEKLGVLCAAAALLPIMAASVIVLYEISSRTRGRALDQLQMNARVAAGIYEKRLEELRSAALRVADDVANRAIISSDSAARDSGTALARLQDLLPRAQSDLGLDFVVVANTAGKTIARRPMTTSTLGAETLSRPVDKNPVVDQILNDGRLSHNSAVGAAVIEHGEWLERMGLDRVAKVDRPDGSSVEDALMLEAAAPIVSGGQFVGLVLIGQMLNTFYKDRAGASPLQVPLIAEVRQILYGEDERAGSLIALSDTIVASSLSPTGADGRGEPGLKGTRRDTSKSDELMVLGTESYSVSWQPIKGLDGSQLGAIGIAVPSNDFDGPLGAVRTTLFVTAVVSSLIAAILGFLLGRSLGTRVTTVIEAANRMAVGELSTTVKDPAATNGGLVPGFLVHDEISRLAEELDNTRESFRQAIERMRKR
jgi:HAMP domain-containing protein